MKILAIETSCDETAVAILECSGDEYGAQFSVLGNGIHSQIATHQEYGGVFPMLAKREHAKNAVPMLTVALDAAGMLTEGTTAVPEGFDELLTREQELGADLRTFLSSHAAPDIDAIAITYGPGLEPALWVGVNFAKALALAWDKPLVPVNHMEGHMLVSLLDATNPKAMMLSDISYPVLGLLISGGHTELALMRDWLSYEVMGETRDDAVGEAFDKVARMLGLPYPGGPEISKLAEMAREEDMPPKFNLPKPMINMDDCDFSFSGLKTAVLYLLKDRTLTDYDRMKLAQAFEDAVTEVLYTKTVRAIEESDAKTVVVGGGVSANQHIGEVFRERLSRDYSDIALHISDRKLTGDNAVMIAVAGYFRAQRNEYRSDFSADGNLALTA